MNNYDDMMEVSDFDEDIKRRKALIEEAKKIPESAEWNDVFREISDLKRKWKRVSYWESAYEDAMDSEFDALLDVFYAKRRQGLQNAQLIKEDLITQAQAILKQENLNQATSVMNDLMDQWKASGSAGKDLDDTLWEAFNTARQAFFDRKHQNWEDMKTRFENARDIKQKLIEEAKELANSEDWKATSEALRHMMDQWKAAGSAGKDHEDNLWNAFHEARQVFYERRDVYYQSIREQQATYYEAKKALIKKASAIFSRNEFSKEHTQEMKALGEEWKTIATCNRDQEDQVWKEFRSIMDAYFAGLKQCNDQRQLKWRQRLQEVRAHKLELIQDQKRQIKYMESEIIGLIGERAIDEMKEEIEDKESFIEELEADVHDIDKKLSN